MGKEIAEQPAALARLLAEGAAPITQVARRLARIRPRFVLLASRGTSGHAALYAKYLMEVQAGLPGGLASPSAMTTYGSRPAMDDVLFVGVSQSGRSPDLVESVTVARQAGATTLAVTNDPSSPLAHAAAWHVDILAGPERAVAATKTYTAQLLALWLLTRAMAGLDTRPACALPEAAALALAPGPAVGLAAGRLGDAKRLVVTSRGYSYPTAREAALKLMETSYVSAQAFSTAELQHGPMAVVDGGVPVVAIVPEGRGGLAMAPVLARLARAGAPVLTVGPGSPGAIARADLPVPAGLPEDLAPIVEILPLQQLALNLALARGADPDRPRRLRKVTETR
ncbi:MAG: SIS domain-containing protein [Acidimicrobiales bacterium]